MEQQKIFNNMGAQLRASMETVVRQIKDVFIASGNQTTTRHVVFTKLDHNLERKLVVVCTNEGDPGVDGPVSVDAMVMYNAVGEPKLLQYRMTYDGVTDAVSKGEWAFRAEIADMADCLFFVTGLVGAFSGSSFSGVDGMTTINK